MLDKLHNFLHSPMKTVWLETEAISVFVRKSVRYIGGRRVRTFDIANVTVAVPGRGTFTRFLDLVEGFSFVVYIESVLNGRLEAYLVRRGYTLHEGSDPPSYYKVCSS